MAEPTPKDYTLILYNKTEIDAQTSAEASRVDEGYEEDVQMRSCP